MTREEKASIKALIDRIKKLEKEVEQLKKYFECFARFNRLGLPEAEE